MNREKVINALGDIRVVAARLHSASGGVEGGWCIAVEAEGLRNNANLLETSAKELIKQIFGPDEEEE